MEQEKVVERAETVVIGQPCMEHSGMLQRYENIEESMNDCKKRLDNNCKKLDSIKLWIIGLLGAAVLQLIMQVLNGRG